MTDEKENIPQHLDDSYTTMILSYLAAFLVGLGIISLIAANWQQIGDTVKLVGILLILAANAGGIIWAVQKQKNIFKQVLCCLYAFLIMGAIGLIGQIYHLRPELFGAMLLWCAISWPLLLITPRLLWLWIPAFWSLTNSYSYGDIFTGIFSDNQTILKEQPIVFTLLKFLSTWGVVLAYSAFIALKPQTDKSIINPLRVYSALMLLNFYRFGLGIETLYPEELLQQSERASWQQMGQNIAVPLLFAYLIYWLNSCRHRFSFMPLFLSGIVLEQLLKVFLFVYMSSLEYEIEMFIPLVYVLIMFAYASYHKMPRLKMLCAISLLIWFIAMFARDITDLIPCLVICAFFAVFAYLNNKPKLFNTAILLLVLRILGYYADVDDLTHAGISMIISGLVLILTVLGLRKYGKLLWEKKND